MRPVLFAIAVLAALVASALAPKGALAAPAEKPWVLIIDVHETDRHPGNLDLNDGQAIAHFEKAFPGNPVALIRGNTSEEVRERLQGFGSGNTRISGLYVMSHGSTQDLILSRRNRRNYSEMNRELVNKRFIPTIANEKGDFSVELNNPESVQKTFGPIRGRFTNGAKIVFGGCRLLEKGTPLEKAQVMKQVAINFGLNDGTLYMNETDGRLYTRSAFQQPFYEQPTSGERAVSLFLQATPLFSLPVLWALEHLGNRGYSLRVENGKARLYQDTFFNAEKGRAPLGQKRGQVAASISDRMEKVLTASETKFKAGMPPRASSAD